LIGYRTRIESFFFLDVESVIACLSRYDYLHKLQTRLNVIVVVVVGGGGAADMTIITKGRLYQ